ncbi:hypothetical protein HPC49_05120 [Pyxidicoccus fallax]|uniref:Lipoprotein n=1 Tax=Pyxidicoccus fallax TaxID=394095 RepID=A0A848L9L9_9BACT|nr:hypothetical protein [Pyxidicoccus fallax]NMO15254.1 hypothetical protein [Pyxidicoccus fallax]NPC77633.1 hypothetical protein [Pyxidicoccus fallax]
MKLSRFVKSLVVSCALGSTAGCGEALRDGEYVGEAIYVVQGDVKSLAPVEEGGTTRVTLAWDNWVREGDIISFQGVELTSKNPPFDYELRVVEPPALEMLNELEDGRIGFAYLYVYEDLDGDGRPDHGQSDWSSLRGMARNHVVVYVPELTGGLKATLRELELFTNVDALKPGFNLARGVCATEENTFDKLEIVPNEPVTVSAPDDGSVPSCINYH